MPTAQETKTETKLFTLVTKAGGEERGSEGKGMGGKKEVGIKDDSRTSLEVPGCEPTEVPWSGT